MAPIFGILLAFLWTTAASADRLTIRPAGDRFTKPLGSSIVLTCELQQDNDDDAQDVVMQWLNDERTEIADSPGRVYVEKDGATVQKLYITAIKNADAGSYTCVADVAGVKSEKSVGLMLFKDITFDHAPSPQHPPRNSNWLIECIVSGQPRPEVSWRFKGQRIVSRGRFVTEASGLRINNITEDDNGDYTCRAEVEAEGRYDERRLSLIVHIPPVISEIKSPVEGVAGQTAVVSCHASGFPAPKYEFRKDGDDKIVSSEHVEVNAVSGNMTFRRLKKDNEGRYSCHAINDVGNVIAYIELKVLVPAEIYEFDNVTQPENSRAALVCLARGDPTPNMTLFKISKYGNLDLVDVGVSDHASVSSESGRLQLVVNKLTPEDTSSYVCRAKNIAGVNESTASITVSYKPRFAMYHDTLIYSWAGKMLNISCQVHAHPSPSVEWIHNQMILANNDTYHIYESPLYHYLQIRVTDDGQQWIFGDYVCQATNVLGQSSYTFTLMQATVPDKPQGIKIKERTPNLVVIEVLPPLDNSGLEVLGYRIEYEGLVYDFNTAGERIQESNADSGRNGTMEASPDEDIRLENLRPSTTYVLRIGVKNEVGVGKLIEEKVTTENVREPYPIHINSPHHGEKHNEYLVKWEKPRTGGQPIVKYHIRYRRVKVKAGSFEIEDALSSWVQREMADNTAHPLLEYQLTGLSSSSHYQVEVLAANKMGKSTPSNKFVFVTAEGDDEPDIAPVQASVGMTTVLGVVIALLIALLIIIDISCYFMHDCGLTMCICVHICGHESGASGAGLKSTEKELEEGESKEMLKPPSSSSPNLEVAKMVQEQVISESDEPLVDHQLPPPVTEPMVESIHEEELRPKNRRSVLSQGDERWKDVVQELENQLGRKKVLHEDDEIETSKSKELEIDRDDERMPLTTRDHQTESPVFGTDTRQQDGSANNSTLA